MLKPELLMQEIQARITHQVLFILQPPSLLPFRGKPFDAQDSVDLAYYSPKRDDGFSQARSKSVFTGADIPFCSNVTEIKTDKDFSIEKKDVIAILVPEHLVETCHEIFSATGIDIISVSSSQKTLRCLPQILEMSFKETLTDPLSLHVPKYATVLDAYCQQNKISHFSLHAVRLNTDSDFTLRPIANGHLHQAVLKSVHARIAHQNEDGLAWAVIHKKYGQSKDELIKNLGKHLPAAHMESFLRINRRSMDNFKQLASLKGEHLINMTYVTLQSGQVDFLLKHGIDLARTPYYFMMHCSKEKTPLLKKVIDEFETIQQEQATVIQSHVRGYHCQKFFKGYQKAKHKMEAAQYEMEANKQWLLSKIR
jgi:hypothetical protein